MTHEEMLDTAQEREEEAYVDPELLQSLGANITIEKEIPSDVVWIDEAFYIKKTMFGLHTSVLKNPLGANFLTSLEYDGCMKMTRWHLKCLQDGTLGDHSYVVNSGIVSGKL
jgi:hypothetical protein